MPTTPNYSWPTPADTDLVKDGAEAIRDLGNAVDTTVKAVSDGRGLVHINTTDFTSVSGVNINNVFSATYKHYKLFLQVTTLQSANFRLRASGTDNSSNDYSWGRKYAVPSNTGGFVTSYKGSSFQIADGIGSYFSEILIANPFDTAYTGYALTSVIYNDSVAGSTYFNDYQGLMRVTTSYDGFSLLFGGNATGTITVLGVRD
jgi:hypothetical protein